MHTNTHTSMTLSVWAFSPFKSCCCWMSYFSLALVCDKLPNPTQLTVCEREEPRPGQAEWAQWKYTTQIHYFMLLRPVTKPGNTPGHSLFLSSPPLAWWGPVTNVIVMRVEDGVTGQLNSQMVTIKTISNIEIIRCLKTSKWQTKYQRHRHCIIRNQVKSVH